VGIPKEAGPALFTLAWVRAALHKLHYLEATMGPASESPGDFPWDPQEHYPLTFFADGRCLNVSLACRAPEAFGAG
jgi:hypothetical protein